MSALTGISHTSSVSLAQQLTKTSPSNAVSSQSFLLNNASYQPQSQISLKSEVLLPSKTIQSKVSRSVPSIAFGKAEWRKYFGDVGVEPQLPADIKKILKEPCSFWPDKKVKETHLLVLIPNTANGKSFTMNYLEDLIEKPKSGYTARHRFYSSYAK